MGSSYKAHCNVCLHEFRLIKGGGWTWYQKICDQCGKEIRVPRQGPLFFEDEKSLTYEELLKHLTNPDQWSRKGGKFDTQESRMLAQMTSVCDCGGNLIPEWDDSVAYRCEKCKSTQLILTNETLFD